MKSSLFPDVNVWLALTHRRHIHHQIAADWFRERDEAMYFCRFTQLALLRLLTNEQVMGTDVGRRQEALDSSSADAVSMHGIVSPLESAHTPAWQ